MSSDASWNRKSGLRRSEIERGNGENRLTELYAREDLRLELVGKASTHESEILDFGGVRGKVVESGLVRVFADEDLALQEFHSLEVRAGRRTRSVACRAEGEDGDEKRGRNCRSVDQHFATETREIREGERLTGSRRRSRP